MIDTSEKWLRELGVSTTQNTLLQDLAEMTARELELRVGGIVADKLTDEQIEEFSKIDDEDKRIEWLETAYPDYAKIVASEHSKISHEIKDSQDKISLIRSWETH